MLEHVDYGASFETSDYDIAPLATLGAFSTSGATGWRSFEVTSAVASDLETASRAERSQYRLRFTIANNGDAATDIEQLSTAEATVNPPELELRALVP